MYQVRDGDAMCCFLKVNHGNLMVTPIALGLDQAVHMLGIECGPWPL